ncbi:hypothetical protein V1281_001972 [Nitrobacteraceae bacterium AZCC 2161]
MIEPRTPVSWRHALEWKEPAIGFASRLAALNGRPMRAFLREMKIEEPDLQQNRSGAIDSLAALGVTDPTLLLRFSPIPQESMASIGSEWLHRRSVRHQRCSFCPHCIQNDLSRYEGPEVARPWLRLNWMVSHFRSCDEHNVTLLLTPVKDNSWTFFDFAEAIARVTPSVSELCENTQVVSPSPFQGWLNKRIEGCRDSENWLDSMELYAAIDFCESLGLSVLSNQHRPINSTTGLHTTRSRVLSVAQLGQAADEGFAIASRGEDEINRCFVRLMEQKMTVPGQWGIRDTFGRIHELLETTMDNVDFKKARDVLRRFLFAELPLEAGSIVLGETLDRRVVHTITSVADDTGFTGSSVRRLLARKGMIDACTTPELPNHRTIIKSAHIELFIEDLKTCLNTAQVAELTFMHRMEVRHLIKAGILPVISDAEKVRDGKLLISKSAAETVFEPLFRRSVAVENASDRQTLFLDLARESRRHIIHAVISGQLWTGLIPGPRDFRSLLVDSEEITGLLGHQRARTGLKKSEVVNMIIGMESGSIPKLISAGHLMAVKEYCPKARKTLSLIPRESVTAFQKKYISSVEIARSAACGPHTIVSRFSRSGLEPVFDAKTYRATFYLRSSVDRILLAKESS